MRAVRWTMRILAVLAVAYLYFSRFHPKEKAAEHLIFAAPGPWAMAHRGGAGLWPENTLFAFEKAEALGVDVLEMDLRATADGHFVVIHDGSVDRTTDGSGRVDQMKLADVRRLDAGYRFRDASGQFPFRGQGIAVPTLEEVLVRFPRARLNIEMKRFTPELAGKFCRVLETHGASNRVLVASAGREPMEAFRESCPAVATSVTFLEGLILYHLNRFGLASLYRGPAVALQVPEELDRRQVVDPDFLRLAAEMNVRVQVWVVNEEAAMKRLLDLGVQGILTDYPDRLLRLMGRSAPPESAAGPAG